MLVSQLLSLPADVVVEELLLEKQVLTLVLVFSYGSFDGSDSLREG